MYRARWAGLALALLSIVLAGCGNATEGATNGIDQPSNSAAEQTVALSGKVERDDNIGLVWDTRSVHVGDSWDAASKVFPERAGAYELRQLPARFGKEFESHGWETNAGEGYGVITYRDNVVAAIYHVGDIEESRAREIVTAQRNGTGPIAPRTFADTKLEYTFWEDHNQRLMTLLEKTEKGFNVTIAMGDQAVLDAIGASPRAALALVGRIDEPGTRSTPGTASPPASTGNPASGNPFTPNVPQNSPEGNANR